QHYVRGDRAGERDRLFAIGRLSDDVDVRLRLEDAAQPLSEDGMIVGDQHPDLFHSLLPPCGPTLGWDPQLYCRPLLRPARATQLRPNEASPFLHAREAEVASPG